MVTSSLDFPRDGRILVVDLAYIGDLLMSTPALACLRRAFPEARIEILVSPGSRAVIERNPDVNEVLTTDMKRGGVRAAGDEAGRIAERNYDLALCFHRGHGTLMMLRKAGIRRRVGFTNGGRGFFLTGGIPFELWRHRAWNHLRLVEKSLGVEVDYSQRTRLDIEPDAEKSVKRLLDGVDGGSGFVAINPNAAWATKRWLPERFAEVADKLAGSGLKPLLIGSPGEERVASQVKARMKTEALDFTGRTSLSELAALLKQCRLIVTNDSGPMHMAQALGVPVVSIFGPTDPGRCGPWGGGCEPVQASLDCIKCYRKTCWHLSCMRSVGADQVVDRSLSCISLYT
jgi:heptosyltransferase-2